jgi:drug/metabolite transporter (DMT)-like permease
MLTKGRALVLNLLVVVCWSLVPVMIRATRDFFPVSFQNFFRYFVSLLVIWPVFALSRPGSASPPGRGFKAGPGGAPIPGLFVKLLIIAAAGFAFQVGFTTSLFLVDPAFVVLLQRSGLFFSVIMAAFLVPDERALLRRRGFQAGLAGALAGMALVVLGGRELGAVELSSGVLLVLMSSFSWSLLTVLVKRWLSTFPASYALAVIFTITTPFFLLMYLLSGGTGGQVIPTAPAGMWIVLSASGLIGVAVGQSFYYRSVPVLGVATAAILDLLRPFVVGILSFLLFRERLAPLQLAGGLLLVACSYLVIRLRFRGVSRGVNRA